MIYIGDRDDFYEDGVSPRQRRVFVLRSNPSMSLSTETFLNS